MNEQELKEIEARAEAATPGPWQAIDPADFSNQHPGWDVNGPYTIHDDEDQGFMDGRTANFIAHARQDVPALCEEMRRLKDRVKELETSVLDNAIKQLETITQNDLQAENARLRAALKPFADFALRFIEHTAGDPELFTTLDGEHKLLNDSNSPNLSDLRKTYFALKGGAE